MELIPDHPDRAVAESDRRRLADLSLDMSCELPASRVRAYVHAYLNSLPTTNQPRPAHHLWMRQAVCVLRRRPAAFGFVEVLRVVDHEQDEDEDQEEPLAEGEQVPPAGPVASVRRRALRRYTTRWRWFG
jgi:hypothetical protein